MWFYFVCLVLTTILIVASGLNRAGSKVREINCSIHAHFFQVELGWYYVFVLEPTQALP